MKASDIRPGVALRMDGHMYLVTGFNHLTPGNLRALVQLKMRNVVTGLTLEKRLRSADEVEQVDLDRRQIEYIYSDATGHVFMDQETFDQLTLSREQVGEAIRYLRPNTACSGLIHEGRCITLELPKVVDLKVINTIPVPKGATATNQLKEAELETGLVTRVPPFIAVDEVVRVSTEDGSYISRA